MVVLSCSLLFQSPAHALFGATGTAQLAYLIKIFQENLRRYYQLRTMLHNVRGSHGILKKVNAGLDGVIGVMLTLPIKDQQILGNLRQYSQALKQIEGIYGSIPKSKEQFLQKLHDETVGESLQMISQLLEYTQVQEKNAKRLAHRAQVASPKGAVKLGVEVNSAILHSLNQLIKINGQMLKVQSEVLAMNNKGGKDHVKYLDKMERDFKMGIKGVEEIDYKMPRF